MSLVLVVAGPVFLAALALTGLARTGLAGTTAAIALVWGLIWCSRRAARALLGWWARLGPPPRGPEAARPH